MRAIGILLVCCFLLTGCGAVKNQYTESSGEGMEDTAGQTEDTQEAETGETGEAQSGMTESAEATTEMAEAAVTTEAKEAEETTVEEQTTLSEGEREVCEGLYITELDKYSYTYSKYKDFSVEKYREDGSLPESWEKKEWDWQPWARAAYLNKVNETPKRYDYDEVKQSEQLNAWHIGMTDGTLVEYTELTEEIGRSIYYYNKRVPLGITEFETVDEEQYGYWVIYGMSGSSKLFDIIFSTDATKEEVYEFLDTVRVDERFFSME